MRRFAQDLTFRVHRSRHERDLEVQREAAYTGVATSGDLVDFGHLRPDDGAVLARIGQPQRQAFGEQAVQLARHDVETVRRDDEVEAVGFALACQRHERFQQVIVVVGFGIRAEGFDVFREVVDGDQHRGFDLGWVATVVLVQRRNSGLAEQLFASVHDVVEFAPDLLHALLVAALVGHDDRADVRQRPQHFEVAPAQVQHMHLEFGGRVHPRHARDQRAQEGRLAPA